MSATDKIILLLLLLCLPTQLVPSCASPGILNNRVAAETIRPVPEHPAEVLTGVRVINVGNIDLSANTYKLDFYIWFFFEPDAQLHEDVQNFEFLNGNPTINCVSNYTDFLEYRVIGDFTTSFDCGKFPFDSYTLSAGIEHDSLNSSYIIYTIDKESSLDKTINNVGWGLSQFNTSIQTHKLAGTESFSDFFFSIKVTRPYLNSFVKFVLPILIITIISLSTFFINPGQYSQRITIIVTTMIAASATHLGIMNQLPPTAYLTISDRIIFSVYIIFLANLAVTVYLMRLVDQSKLEEASIFNKQSFKLLFILLGALLVVQFFI